MSTAKVTSKGQITLPLNVRQRLGIETGDRVEFIDNGNGEFSLRPIVDDVRALKGLLKKPAQKVSIEGMRAAIRKRGAGK
jgi:AbrB family looped-hinge helix DNA binding protein